jgi:hypothetical protein
MAGPYPLATLGCTITAAGITAPQYSDILASLTASARGVYGSDIYLGTDTKDGQLLAIFALAQFDQNQQTIATYNTFSPTYAQGAALASLVKINGITVSAPTNSTCPVVIQGVAGTPIPSGVIKDTAGNLWNLPGTVVIGISGAVTVTATAQTAGSLQSPINTLTGIYTPVSGWQSVTNLVAGAIGVPQLTDAQVRVQQQTAVALPAQGIGGGILAAVQAVPGVGLATLYDNDTKVPDANGVPGNCIAVVAQGGLVQSIINAIGARKTPGTNTQGNVSGFYTDPVAGLTNPINYFALTPVPVQINVTIHPQIGYLGTTATAIVNSLVQFVASFGIGQDIYLTKLYGPCNLYGDAATTATGLTQQQLDTLSNSYTVTGLTIGFVGGTPVSADLPINYVSLATLTAVNVTVTVV